MTYAIKTHTRGNSFEFLDHILNIFETESTNIRKAFQAPDNDILTLVDFVGTPVEELITITWEDEDKNTKNFTKKELRLLKNMHAWILWEEKN